MFALRLEFFVYCFSLGFREMEKGFLNTSNKTTKVSNGNISSVLSGLAKRVKNIDGKILGKDGKPMKPYRCVKNKVPSTGLVNDDVVVMENKVGNVEEGCSKSASNGNEKIQVSVGTMTCVVAKVN